MIEIIRDLLDDWYGRFLVGAMIVLIVLLPFIINQEHKDIEAMRVACEAKNGTLLDHTTRVMIGKTLTEEHKYVCIDKNLIIRY